MSANTWVVFTAYCIRSNAFYDNRCTNTDCDRHEANAPLVDDDSRRVWAEFECKEYKHE